MLNSKSRTALAVAATAGLAAAALLAVLRCDSMRNSKVKSELARNAIDRWDDEGGNIPEVSVNRGEQGSVRGLNGG